MTTLDTTSWPVRLCAYAERVIFTNDRVCPSRRTPFSRQMWVFFLTILLIPEGMGNWYLMYQITSSCKVYIR